MHRPLCWPCSVRGRDRYIQSAVSGVCCESGVSVSSQWSQQSDPGLALPAVTCELASDLRALLLVNSSMCYSTKTLGELSNGCNSVKTIP